MPTWSRRVFGRQDRVLATVDTEFATTPAPVRRAIKEMLGSVQPTDGVMVNTQGYIENGDGSVSINIDLMRLVP